MQSRLRRTFRKIVAGTSDSESSWERGPLRMRPTSYIVVLRGADDLPVLPLPRMKRHRLGTSALLLRGRLRGEPGSAVFADQRDALIDCVYAVRDGEIDLAGEFVAFAEH
jgi:hypothetical protein